MKIPTRPGGRWGARNPAWLVRLRGLIWAHCTQALNGTTTTGRITSV